MYLEYYNLSKEPFGVTPDPEFLYLSPTHKEALAVVIYGIRARKGFICITGEVGTGKTTILRSALQRLNSNSEEPIYIFHPNLSFNELLKNIFYELGIKEIPRQTDDMLRRLREALIEYYAAGRNVFLVIDEAQNMPVDTLENLRMLTNLETTKDKLLQIVLLGQPELETKLARYELRQLRQRIAVRAVLKPLSNEESINYIKHRLIVADAPRVWIFTEGAKQLIVEHARGNPRLINIICDNALICGFGHQKKIIASDIVREVINDLLETRAEEVEGPGETFEAAPPDVHSLRTSLANAPDAVKREALRALLELMNDSRPETPREASSAKTRAMEDSERRRSANEAG